MSCFTQPTPLTLQAFRHSYGLTLEWRFFEPLLLMIDEVYRSRSSSSLGAMRAAQRDKLRVGNGVRLGRGRGRGVWGGLRFGGKSRGGRSGQCWQRKGASCG